MCKIYDQDQRRYCTPLKKEGVQQNDPYLNYIICCVQVIQKCYLYNLIVFKANRWGLTKETSVVKLAQKLIVFNDKVIDENCGMGYLQGRDLDLARTIS